MNRTVVAIVAIVSLAMSACGPGPASQPAQPAAPAATAGGESGEGVRLSALAPENIARLKATPAPFDLTGNWFIDVS
jgi:hypothetical protein